MHILFLSDNFPPEVNASASRVYERARYWVNWGHQVTVITCAPNFPEGRVFKGFKNKWHQVEMMHGIRVVRVKTFIAPNKGASLRIFDFLSYAIMALFAGLWQKKPDIIVATSPQFFAAVSAWLLSKLRRKPFIFELGDIWPASITAVGAMKPSKALQWLEKLELHLYREAKRVVCLTPAFKDNLISRGINAEKLDVVINGVELSRFSPGPKDPEFVQRLKIQDRFVIGYIGTLGMAHDLGNVIDAAKLCQSNPNLVFLFVGSGAEKEKLQQQAKDLDNIIFVPRQNKKVVVKLWRVCDLALVHLKNAPAFSEVIPSKLFEIMGMGLPMLCAAPEGEATKIIQQTKAGLCVPAGDPKALAKAIQQLVTQPEQLATYANNSYLARLKYTREQQAKAMIDCLQLALMPEKPKVAAKQN